MKKYFALLVITAVVFACNQDSTGSDSLVTSKEYPLGLYKAEIGMDQLMKREEIDTADALTKMVLSFASLLEIRINFQDNGYLKLEGDFGFFNFPGITDNQDSIKYYINNDELVIEDDKIEVNGNDKIYIKPNDTGFSLLLDSLEIKLVKVN
jgi:hypothetical protein